MSIEQQAHSVSVGSSDEQAVVSVVEITDPTAASDDVELIDLDAVQLQSTPFRARRIVVCTGTASVLCHSTNRRVRTCTRIREGYIAYCVFGPRAQGTINGIAVHPGLMLAVAPGAEVRVVVNADWQTATFLLPPDFVRAHLSARHRRNESRLPQGVEMLAVDAGAANKLFAWGTQLAETAAEHASTFNEGKVDLPAIECELVETLLATIGAAANFKPSSNDRTRQRRSHIVKIAEEYALAKNGTNIYVTDLCKVTKVSERTLVYAFREVMGLTPVAFLCRLRLHRVRNELLAASPRSTTVAHEALRWGFWHFGEFARTYSDCFGELPSLTLLRTSSRERRG